MPVRITQLGREVLKDGDPAVLITQAGREVLKDGTPTARFTQLGREVLRSRATVAAVGRRFVQVNIVL
jgi:ribosomal protein L34